MTKNGMWKLYLTYPTTVGLWEWLFSSTALELSNYTLSAWLIRDLRRDGQLAIKDDQVWVIGTPIRLLVRNCRGTKYDQELIETLHTIGNETKQQQLNAISRLFAYVPDLIGTAYVVLSWKNDHLGSYPVIDNQIFFEYEEDAIMFKLKVLD